jgi:TATA-box binding protein (TBP) (component of TFIID and TFIIIB)
MIKTDIVNVVATASIYQEIDFYELRKNKEIFHDSDVYGGRVAYFKTPEMKGKVSIFQSGKMISVGTRSETQACNELQLATKFLVDKGYAKAVELNFKTKNMVVTADFEKSLNLEKLSENTKAIYEPEQFPRAIVRFEKPYKTCVLVFASGKAVITGLKSTTQIEPTIAQLKKIVESSQ